jgi:hypothetical protein
MATSAKHRFELQKRRQLFIRMYASARLSRDQSHRELVYGLFHFHKRSRHFIGANDEALPVAMRANDPDGPPVNIES